MGCTKQALQRLGDCARTTAVMLTFASLGACSPGVQPAPIAPLEPTKPEQYLTKAGWQVFNEEHGEISTAAAWRLAGQPEQYAGHTESGETWLRDMLAQKKRDDPSSSLQTSAQVQCYAREQAAFWRQHHQGPSEVLERYMAAACGLWGYRPLVAHKRIPVQESASLASQIHTALLGLGPRGTVGVHAQAQMGSGATLTVVYDQTPFRWEPVPLLASQSGVLEFSPASTRAALVDGVANRGLYSWSDCRVKRANRRHGPKARCRYSTEDPITFIEMLSTHSDKAQNPSLFRVAAFGEAGIPLAYTPDMGWDTQVHENMGNSAYFLRAVNELRRQSGMPRIVVDPFMSLRIDEWWRKSDKEELKEQFFSQWGRSQHTTPQLRSVTMASFVLPKDLSAGDAIRHAIALPQVRLVLLNPASQSIALRQYKIEGRDAVETVVASKLFSSIYFRL